jgi:hypothetical protein
MPSCRSSSMDHQANCPGAQYGNGAVHADPSVHRGWHRLCPHRCHAIVKLRRDGQRTHCRNTVGDAFLLAKTSELEAAQARAKAQSPVGLFWQARSAKSWSSECRRPLPRAAAQIMGPADLDS